MSLPDLSNPQVRFNPDPQFYDTPSWTTPTQLVAGQSYRYDRTVHLTDTLGLDDWKARFQFNVTQSLPTYSSL